MPVLANCGNGNGNGNGCNGSVGPQGPKGDKGDTGASGLNGTNGVDGANGTNGKDSQVDSHFSESNLAVDAAVRLYDSKRLQLQAFNIYGLGRHRGDDIFGNGHNLMYGMRLVLKLGKSYEEKRIEDLNKKISRLERLLYGQN